MAFLPAANHAATTDYKGSRLVMTSRKLCRLKDAMVPLGAMTTLMPYS